MRVLDIFLREPSKRFQLRELSRKCRLSTTAVKSSLTELEKEKLVVRRKDKMYTFFESNKDSDDYKVVKRFFTAISISRSGLLDYLDSELNRPEAIVLFGSAAKGEDAERSDVDIFVLTETPKEIALGKFEKTMGKQIKIMAMDKDDFEEAKRRNPELINNIANGMVLRGFLEVI